MTTDLTKFLPGKTFLQLSYLPHRYILEGGYNSDNEHLNNFVLLTIWGFHPYGHQASKLNFGHGGGKLILA